MMRLRNLMMVVIGLLWMALPALAQEETPVPTPMPDNKIVDELAGMIAEADLSVEEMEALIGSLEVMRDEMSATPEATPEVTPEATALVEVQDDAATAPVVAEEEVSEEEEADNGPAGAGLLMLLLGLGVVSVIGIVMISRDNPQDGQPSAVL